MRVSIWNFRGPGVGFGNIRGSNFIYTMANGCDASGFTRENIW